MSTPPVPPAVPQAVAAGFIAGCMSGHSTEVSYRLSSSAITKQPTPLPLSKNTVLLLDADFTVDYAALIHNCPAMLQVLLHTTENANSMGEGEYRVVSYNERMGSRSPYVFYTSSDDKYVLRMKVPIDTLEQLPPYKQFVAQCVQHNTIRAVRRDNPLWPEILKYSSGGYRVGVLKYKESPEYYHIQIKEDACGTECVMHHQYHTPKTERSMDD